MLRQPRFGALLYSVAIAFGNLAASGCSESYQAGPQVIPPAGTGATGATGAVGAGTAGRPAGGRAGSNALPGTGGGAPIPRGGEGGSNSAGSGWADPNFSARLDGASVMLDVVNPRGAFYMTCRDAMVLQKLDAATGAWTKPIDQRPPSYNNPGYYLDGRYVPPSFDEGCDVIACVNFDTEHFVAKAAEYVQEGVAEVQTPNGPVYVPWIETRPLTGALRVVVQFALGDATCKMTQSALLYLMVGGIEGVCCPVGNPGCNSSGPAGGWALDTASCRPFVTQADTYYRRAVDAHGCMSLLEDPSECCGCFDAGVGE